MTVFILGAGVMQIPAIRAAKELGWTVVAADADSGAPGVGEADRFVHVDLKDLDGLVGAARGISSAIGLDGVFTAGTDFSTSVAWVAQELGLPGIPFETALKASDKLRMRAALEAAGVPSPRYVAAGRADDPSAVAAGLGFPLVVKPADSMGARGCRAARDPSELAEALSAALPYSRSGMAIIEEFVEGPEFSIDALVEGDEIRIRGVADRHIAFLPCFVELGHSMPSAYPPEVVDEVLRVFRLGVKAIGIDIGAAKGDMKFCPSRGGAVVGEIAARLSGGYMSGWTYPYASGIDPAREALRLSVGMGLGAGREDRGWASAERAFISIPGRIASIEGRDEAERTPYVKQLFLRVSVGDRVVFPTNNVEKCGNVISQAPSREEAVRAAVSAAGAMRLRLAAGEPETESFLGSNGSHADGWPPPAFVVEGEAARELATMPEYLDCAAPGEGPIAPFALAGSVMGGDWSGRGFAESADLALSLRQIRREGERGRSESPPNIPARRRTLAGRFWRALARGGLQAALYVLDTEDAAPGIGRNGGSGR
jgi:biotin carboxylase